MDERKKIALKIINILNKNKYKAYLVGGCVRDMIMNNNPKDYDIVTDAKPKDIIKLFKRTIKVGMKFGIIKVICEKQEYEIATFRKDGEYIDGRRPQTIEFSDEKEDTLRRDFTINGLIYDPINNNIIDYVNGKNDIKNKIIRTIGEPNKRFSEDYLRLIRAIRFAARLNFDIEKKTWIALVHLAHNIKKISKERISDELKKILINENRELAIRYLFDSSIFKYITIDLHKQFENNENKLNNLLAISSKLKCDIFEVYYSLFFIIAFLEKYYKSEPDKNIQSLIKKNCLNLKLSNKETKKIIEIFNTSFKLWISEDYPVWKLKRLFRSTNIMKCIEIDNLINNIYNFNDSSVEYIKYKYSKYKDDLYITPYINGEDLIKLGFKGGKIFSQILFDVENFQLENKITSKEEAILYIKKNYKS